MSLTSYRAAPPRVTMWAVCQPGSVFVCSSRRCRSERRAAPPACVCWAVCASPEAFCSNAKRAFAGPLVQAFASRVRGMAICVCEWVFVSRVVCRALASMPGDVLLFQRLSVSTIGAVRFHGRVRDGIGWVTDAMVTKQWSWRVWCGF